VFRLASAIPSSDGRGPYRGKGGTPNMDVNMNDNAAIAVLAVSVASYAVWSRWLDYRSARDGRRDKT
jgi:hypothetical protein